MYEEFFYQRLSRLRTRKNVSAREMSLALGQSEGYINAIENQKSMPSMTAFFYICEYLDITPCEFFSTENPYPAELNEAIEALKELSPEQIENITYLARQMKKNK